MTKRTHRLGSGMIKKKVTLEWEDVSFDNGRGLITEMHRMKVFGGWIVLESFRDRTSKTSVFVPDPDHKWVIEKEGE